MNLRRHYWILAASAVFTLAGFSSCKDYSSDQPFPDVYSQSVFVSSNNQILYAVDPVTGERKWEFPVDGEVHATPLLFNKHVYVATTKGIVYKIDAQYGKQIVTRNFAANITGTPIVRDGVLLVPAGTKLYGVDVNSLGDILNLNPFEMGGNIMSSPTLRNIAGGQSKAIFVSGMNNKVVALNQDLQQIWSFEPNGGLSFYSSPCVVNDSFLYVGNDDGYLYAVNTVNGTEKWKFETDGQVRSSPIQIGGNVLFGSNDRNFYSVDSALGQVRWKVTTGDVIQSSPSVFNQNVYFGSYDQNMYCVDIIDGTVQWKMRTFALIKSSPVIFRGDVFFGGFDKNLYRLDANTGAQKFLFNVNGQMATSPIIDSIGGAAVPSISGDYRF